ncbi:orotate phosphoribosyltransferase [Candidatus Contubernalis alkalaceticus]|uniref:orotate phosphoribosyltransferase n=1 Tax=Candidatus Contubernalis alkaliaceticus TaxID=338645 RepID=UPI0029622A73|nr:orotate phosphoribosyltransferase [Candidatus Contubernalis alkalaceticus]UNC93357.1 orotate phosphoribosyltransferase [Candidatus Contubernalis alkalaceticus]
MSEAGVLDIFEKSGVLLEGHFLLTSGKHSRRYMQIAQVLKYPHYNVELCGYLVEPYLKEGIDLVVGPAMGGIIIAYEAGRQLNCSAFFAEREEGKMAFRRGFKISKGQRVLVVEDVITTGGSVKEVIDLAISEGAEVVGAASFVDRSGGKAALGVPLTSLVSIHIETYEPNHCPLCAEGLPLVKPGSRKQA